MFAPIYDRYTILVYVPSRCVHNAQPTQLTCQSQLKGKFNILSNYQTVTLIYIISKRKKVTTGVPQLLKVSLVPTRSVNKAIASDVSKFFSQLSFQNVKVSMNVGLFLDNLCINSCRRHSEEQDSHLRKQQVICSSVYIGRYSSYQHCVFRI